MSYFDKVVTVCNKVEQCQAALERGTLNTCCTDHTFNHGLNRVGKWGVVGGTVRIIHGSLQVAGGLLLSVIFGVGALVTERQSDWNRGHKMLCERSWHQVLHGLANIGRGFVELVPGLSYVAFASKGQERMVYNDEYRRNENQRFIYAYEEKSIWDFDTNFYFDYSKKLD